MIFLIQLIFKKLVQSFFGFNSMVTYTTLWPYVYTFLGLFDSLFDRHDLNVS